MRIIDRKFKDYYDYLQGVYGIDDLVIYDRRDAIKIDQAKGQYSGEYPSWFVYWFSNVKLDSDHEKEEILGYKSKSVKYENRADRPRKVLEGDVYHFVLQIGHHHYFFEVERYLENGKLVLEHTLLSEKRVEKKELFSNAPISIIPVDASYFYDGKYKLMGSSYSIDNPILNNSWIPKVIPPNDTWNDLYEYISSLRDKEFVDTRTNDMHIESNGFDKKDSFRGKVNKKKDVKRKRK